MGPSSLERNVKNHIFGWGMGPKARGFKEEKCDVKLRVVGI